MGATDAIPGPTPTPVIHTLIVDDSESVRQRIEAFIQDWGSIKVVGTATNGDEAFAKVLALRPDLVLMDIDMPVMDGINATQKIKQLTHPPRVIVVSLAPPSLVRAVLKAGADAYCEKHRMHETLGNHIRTLFPNVKGLCANPSEQAQSDESR